jgi:hypothetical protein
VSHERGFIAARDNKADLEVCIEDELTGRVIQDVLADMEKEQSKD